MPARCANGACRPGEHLARLRFGERNQFGDAVHVGRGVDDQHDRAVGQQCDRCEILDDVENGSWTDDLIRQRRERKQEQGVAIVRGVRDGLAGETSRRARLVFDDDLLAEHIGSALGKQARGDVRRRPRRKPDDETDRTRRIGVLCARCAPGGEQRRRACGELQEVPARKRHRITRPGECLRCEGAPVNTSLFEIVAPPVSSAAASDFGCITAAQGELIVGARVRQKMRAG
jgi:hypothetical protein